MKFAIQYVSRRRWQRDVDPEDQSWRTAEIFEGTPEQADDLALGLDQDTDLQFYHRAVPALQRAS